MARARVRTWMSCRGKSGPRPTGHGDPPEPTRLAGHSGAERKRCVVLSCGAGRWWPRDNLAPMIRRAFRLSVVLVPLELAACRSEEHTSALQSLMRTSYAVLCSKKQNIDQHL